MQGWFLYAKLTAADMVTAKANKHYKRNLSYFLKTKWGNAMLIRRIILATVALLGALFAITGCFDNRTTTEGKTDVTAEESYTLLEQISLKNISMDEKIDIMTEVAHNLLEHIASKDSEGFKNMFSSDAIVTEDFEEGLAYSFDLFKGEDITIDKMASISEFGSYYGMATTKTWCTSCSVKTDTGNYRLYFMYYIQDKYNNLLSRNLGENVGKVKTFILIEDTEGVDPYWSGHHVDRSGIYTPEWDDQPR